MDVSCQLIAEVQHPDRLFVQLGIPEVPGDESDVRSGLVRLARHLLGEERSVDDEETDALHALFEGLRDPRVHPALEVPSRCGGAEDPQRWLRAWQGVVAMMLSDYSFLYD